MDSSSGKVKRNGRMINTYVYQAPMEHFQILDCDGLVLCRRSRHGHDTFSDHHHRALLHMKKRMYKFRNRLKL